MQYIQYKIHLILQSKYKIIITILINLTIYLLLYQQNTAYCMISDNPEIDLPRGPIYPIAPENINVDALYADYMDTIRQLNIYKDLAFQYKSCCDELQFANSEVNVSNDIIRRLTKENLEVNSLKDKIKALEEVARKSTDEANINNAIISNIPFMAIGLFLLGAATPQILNMFTGLEIPLW